MGTFKLLCRDVIEALRPLPPNLFHGALCDPPYGLKFMGKKWDHGVPGAEYWSEVLRVLKPGAPILAFGGTRTFHRLACAIEDAGFEIFDSILGAAWIYGQGFPKSLDIGKAIDKRGGYPHLAKAIGRAIKTARESRGLTVGACDAHFCGGSTNWTWFEGRPKGQRAPTPETFDRIAEEWPEFASLRDLVAEAEREVIAQGFRVRRPANVDNIGMSDGAFDITAPNTDTARAWNGYGTALKPAWEPVVFARKPLSGTHAENCIEHGCGGLNIDGSRIGSDTTRGDRYHGKPPGGSHSMQIAGPREKTWQVPAGRYPANLILSHHPDCSPLGTRRVRSGKFVGHNRNPEEIGNKVYGARGKDTQDASYAGEDGLEEVEAWECHPECPVAALDQQSGNRHGDSGGASRFFASFDFRYAPKVSTAERNAGVDSLETIGVYSSTWEGEDRLVARVITDTSQNRVIGVSSTPYNDVSDWSTFLFGRHTTDELCLRAITSTIETETDSITASRTLSFLHSLITSELTHRTTGDRSRESGKSSARTAKSGSRPQLSFGISREVLGRIATVAPAGFAEWLTQSASVRLEFEGRGCRHNTLKPLSLTTYLAKLILPPPHIPSRLLVPFCGTGSEVAGALLAGWGHVVGIDNDPESIATAQDRIPGLIARGTK